MRPVPAGDSSVPEAQQPNRVVRFGVFELDRHSGDLRKDGMARRRLQGQPLDVLLQLLEQPGEIVTREELRQRLWPADTFVDFDHSLNAAVNKLREALEDSASNPRFVQTLARRGYRFIAPVETRESRERGDPMQPTPNGAAAGAAASVIPSAEVPAERRARLLSDARDLPEVPQKTARALFSLIQLLYLGIYITALGTLRIEDRFLSDRTDYATLILAILVATAAAGAAVRLYLLAAAIFGFRGLARQFLRLFLAVFPLDELWALSPFLLLDRIGIGLVMAMTATLLFLPFAQRSILLMGDRGAKPDGNS
ncbi:MAG: winged helix-turn-helix domain-containing protein [Candidatus Acidiferrales bacterium]